MLNSLKNFDAQVISLEEAVVLHAFGRSLQSEFDHLKIEQPEWLQERMKVLHREIGARNQDALEKRIKELTARRETLLSPSERRKALDAELAGLQAALKG